VTSDDDAAARRAARLSRLPGVTLDEACKRCGVTKAALQRARKALGVEAMPGPEDLVLAALTRNGARRRGTLPAELDGLAGFIDYVNKDGCTAAEVRAMLRRLARRRVLTLDERRWALCVPWPTA
jgi:hypothetical protein